jgi:hypothetical protein
MPGQFGPIADAIVANLNGGTWPTGFTAQRGYLTLVLLESLTAFTCVVTPTRRGAELQTKTLLADRPAFIFAFCQNFRASGPPAAATIDGLIATVEAVQDAYLRSKTVLSVAGVLDPVVSLSADLDPAYDPRWLDEELTFMSLLAVEMGAWH